MPNLRMYMTRRRLEIIEIGLYYYLLALLTVVALCFTLVIWVGEGLIFAADHSLGFYSLGFLSLVIWFILRKYVSIENEILDKLVFVVGYVFHFLGFFAILTILYTYIMVSQEGTVNYHVYSSFWVAIKHISLYGAFVVTLYSCIIVFTEVLSRHGKEIYLWILQMKQKLQERDNIDKKSA
ncbi:hypothetical protein [Bacillus alkalicellulosilyticus]|uniref:hypothetical protein n=1 Tax=Alkalihalobacterium alkalicellulosilyticum TaxID=1912214 RepID=UPI000996898C|nr:hypothetical protein [Bacillus alkalicellulosilyticus]